MRTIVIHAHSKPLINGNPNPKNYPYWTELVGVLKNKYGLYIIQIGLENETKYVDDFRTLSLKELKHLLKHTDGWIAVDSFLPHLADRVEKPGVVIMSQSDPKIYGYKNNINLYKEGLLRKNQFDMWGSTPYDIKAFASVDEVVDALKTLNII